MVFRDDSVRGLSLSQVSSRIRADLLQRAGEFNILLEDVSITHLTFGKVSVGERVECWLTGGQEFTQAVEAKQIAQQDAERAKFIVEKVSEPEAAGTATDGRIGGTGAASIGDSGGRGGGGCDDDLTCTGEGWGCIRDVAKDRGEQSDCAVTVAERERDVGASE